MYGFPEEANGVLACPADEYAASCPRVGREVPGGRRVVEQGSQISFEPSRLVSEKVKSGR